MFVYIRSAAFIIVVTQKLVLQQSTYVTAKCTETLLPPSLYSILFGCTLRNTWKLQYTNKVNFLLALYVYFSLNCHVKLATLYENIKELYKYRLQSRRITQ